MTDRTLPTNEQPTNENPTAWKPTCSCGSETYILQCGQSRRTRRWLMLKRKVNPNKAGEMPNCWRRGNAPHASLQCRVVSTK